VGNYWHILTNKAYYVQKWGAESIYWFHARHAFINLAGNVAMFVPLGYLLPAASEKKPTFFRTVLSAAGLIVTVEVLQLFTLLGSCDVDDLILNMIGVVLGFILWKLRRK
jgi:glycopeptide antibiotics resistance protein